MLNYEFANQGLLYLLLLLPVMLGWYLYRSKDSYVDVVLSTGKPFSEDKKSFWGIIKHVLFIFQLIAFALIIVALARPRTTEISEKTIGNEGIDIILALDISGSMLAEDFKPNRLSASKDVALNFIDGRKNDRFGLVVYSGESFTQCPLTGDHNIVKNLMQDVKTGMIENQSTAIGMGLATAVSRLKDSKAKSKVVILLTDGVNNSGFIDPLTAAEIAKKFNIKTYTIGVGSMGEAPYPFKDAFGRTIYQNVPVKIDEKLLKQVSEMTGAKYFRADSKEKLSAIYKEIDKMEKTKLQELTFQQFEEKFFMFAFVAALILLIDRILRFTLLKGIV
ncbi:MAG: VWA domain-containing protein [Saprospiraceae bacterium]|nr:VWA domain-containing protein [Saprospiraceae bacterium]